jgi:hypothetical protein
MSARFLPLEFQTLQALTLLAIAILGLCIAWGQWVTARTKLILDLYDKRRAVYSKFHGPIGQAMREGASDFANYREYIVVLDEAHFLFGRDVQDFIEDMRETLNRLGLATSMLKDGNDQRMAESERMKFVHLSHDCMRELAEFWTRLDRLMIPYMLMEQKRPWSIERVLGYFGHVFRRLIKAVRKWRKKRALTRAALVVRD